MSRAAGQALVWAAFGLALAAGVVWFLFPPKKHP